MSYQPFYKNEGFTKWIAENPYGFIINSSPGSGIPPEPWLNPKYVVGHRPQCSSFKNNPENYSKHCFSTAEEALNFIHSNYPQSDLRLRCPKCKPHLVIFNKAHDNLLEKAINLLGDIDLKKTPPGNKKPKVSTGTTQQYDRDPLVASYVLKASNNSCESCGIYKPFTTIAGRPYLEVHHVKHLSARGSDTVYNTVALCPNCHREIHYGINSKKITENLYIKISRLIRE